ncbi:acetyl-CoA carboxylase, carboxyltransferase subunit beta [Paenibacillus filicis]|uniref:Acetyl-coenzyme A carboxylase carboxyl transferase subunit beta n=1 Tax=Paenibacillus gyeongsangnamensis TaxID=3388067 RepID=A0ABT4Q8J1_9BACL|nr:acetyl-CoA carboxylase, carboxyltransferase subunit beta [Paenibacillus filicis]MCZ8513148.1 acetyl-CoA carboxylase, carboxyltransferase subunit beta [Paenibacillus filicis]
MFFQKKRPYAIISSDRTQTQIPDGLVSKCPQCTAILYAKELEKNLKVCSKCGYHFKASVMERIQMTFDGGLTEYDSDMISEDPLQFPGYKDKLAVQKEKSGLKEAVVTGEGEIGGFPVVAVIMSFDFFAGTMGSVVGEKVTRAVETAMRKKLPLLIFSTSGGARMQESILCLMQMSKTSSAIAKFQEQGGLYISVITDPTYGGVSASFAMLGDIILAEPGAAFGFAGRIVIEQTIRQKLPDNFQKSEFHLQHGQLDQVMHRKDLKLSIAQLLEFHQIHEEVV